MEYLLSLDVGDKRVGVALGTVSPKSSNPLTTFERAAGKAEHEILKLIEKHAICQLVVGLPFNEDGTINEQCAKIEKFCDRIKKRCSVNIVFVDEYASSYEASELMGLKGRPNAKQRDRIDAVAAGVILSRYLESLGSK